MTGVWRSTTVVGVVSSIESNALTTPRFSATKARPSAANRTEIGLTRPPNTGTSRKCGSVKAPAASAVLGGTTRATGAATSPVAAKAIARSRGAPRTRTGGFLRDRVSNDGASYPQPAGSAVVQPEQRCRTTPALGSDPGRNGTGCRVD